MRVAAKTWFILIGGLVGAAMLGAAVCEAQTRQAPRADDYRSGPADRYERLSPDPRRRLPAPVPQPRTYQDLEGSGTLQQPQPRYAPRVGQ